LSPGGSQFATDTGLVPTGRGADHVETIGGDRERSRASRLCPASECCTPSECGPASECRPTSAFRLASGIQGYLVVPTPRSVAELVGARIVARCLERFGQRGCDGCAPAPRVFARLFPCFRACGNAPRRGAAQGGDDGERARWIGNLIGVSDCISTGDSIDAGESLERAASFRKNIFAIHKSVNVL
jgi:hypothetical protein